MFRGKLMFYSSHVYGVHVVYSVFTRTKKMSHKDSVWVRVWARVWIWVRAWI